MTQFVFPIESSEVALANVGGKAINLSRLSQAGFAVPAARFLSTNAYHLFLEENALLPCIESILTGLDHKDSEKLEVVSSSIRKRFSEGQVPEKVHSAIKSIYQALMPSPLAVRSSATAEDLPEMSFAGQQDTYLNVIGEEALMKAVIDCWSSLWTARAIGYRQRNLISHSDAALAVIIQEMVMSDASGVMFTANPVSGLRAQIVIDATLGLGEALVSGQVEPDHYVVNLGDEVIESITLGAKNLVMYADNSGGVRAQNVDYASKQAINDKQILALARIGNQIESLYESPQDIEWAVKGEEIHILQSRPITALYPIPGDYCVKPLKTYFSFGAVQGLLGPMTPLGRDAIRYIFAGGASIFGYEETYQTQKTIWEAGERLWGNFTGIIKHPIGRKVLPRVFSAVEPGSVNTLQKIIAEINENEKPGKIRPGTFIRLGRFVRPLFKKMIHNIRFPEGKVDAVFRDAEQKIDDLQNRAHDFPGERPTLGHSTMLFKELFQSFIYAVPEIMGFAIAGLLPMVLVNKVSRRLTGSGVKALEIMRGIPNNVTTEMDLVLWQTASGIRDAGSAEYVLSNPVEKLSGEFLKGDLPESVQDAIRDFMDQYGMRGVGEIDIGQPRWRENPAPVIQYIQSYLQIEDASMAPDVVFERGRLAAEETVDDLEKALRKTFAGGLKARLFRKLTHAIREFAGLREYPKFHIIQRMGIIRESLLSSGAGLVEAGVIDHPQDLFFLFFQELDALAEEKLPNVRNLIAKRREKYAMEQNRTQIPRLILSDGRVFYKGMDSEDDNVLKGSPVSPGMVEGKVRVVIDPHNADLQPGEIMVCKGTDPAWTPLFLAAGGLIMETGGMMTHGAIVAREYGIPSVVGVDNATQQLKTGDFVKVDGSSGMIQLT